MKYILFLVLTQGGTGVLPMESKFVCQHNASVMHATKFVLGAYCIPAEALGVINEQQKK